MGRSPNDDRSDRFNPTSAAYAAAEENEARQRGDWDDDYESPASTAQGEEVAAELRLEPERISVCQGVDPGHRPPTARHACGPRVIDRQSHWLHAVHTIVSLSWDYVYEAAESFRRRQAVTEALRREANRSEDELNAAGERMELVRRGKYGSDADIHLKTVQELLDYATNPARLLKESPPEVAMIQRSPYIRVPMPAELVVAEPVRVRAGWRELLAYAVGELRAVSRGVSGPAGVLFDGANPLHCTERAAPGAVTVRAFATEVEAIEFAGRAEPEVVRDNYQGKVLRPVHALAFPGGEGGAGSLPAGAREEGLRAVEWVAEGMADYWDVRPMLRGMVEAAAMAEWVEYPLCAFGLRVRPDGRAEWDSRAARGPGEAKRLRNGLAQRGFRAVVIPTPRVSGPRMWTAYKASADSPWGGVRPL